MPESTLNNIRKAATVILAREARDGIEVLMLQRTPNAVFAANCHVFPGGVLEDRDHHSKIPSFCFGAGGQKKRAPFDAHQSGLAYRHAAIRECFEESGLLLAVDSQGDFLSLDNPEAAERFSLYRKAVYQGSTELIEICRSEGLRLAIDKLSHFSRWVTPRGASRRFDARFFIGIAPLAQTALHDGNETVAHTWIRPEEALSQHDGGVLNLMRPTVETLRDISGMRNTEQLMHLAQKNQVISDS